MTGIIISFQEPRPVTSLQIGLIKSLSLWDCSGQIIGCPLWSQPCGPDHIGARRSGLASRLRIAGPYSFTEARGFEY